MIKTKEVMKFALAGAIPIALGFFILEGLVTIFSNLKSIQKGS